MSTAPQSPAQHDTSSPLASLWYQMALRWEDRVWHLTDWLMGEALPNGLWQRVAAWAWPFYHLPLALHLPALALSRRYRAFTLVTAHHRRRLGYIACLEYAPWEEGIYADIMEHRRGER